MNKNLKAKHKMTRVLVWWIMYALEAIPLRNSAASKDGKYAYLLALALHDEPEDILLSLMTILS